MRKIIVLNITATEDEEGNPLPFLLNNLYIDTMPLDMNEYTQTEEQLSYSSADGHLKGYPYGSNGFTVVEDVENIPEDVATHKYYYSNGEWTLNENYEGN
jgi:hypothetical protein